MKKIVLILNFFVVLVLLMALLVSNNKDEDNSVEAMPVAVDPCLEKTDNELSKDCQGETDLVSSDAPNRIDNCPEVSGANPDFDCIAHYLSLFEEFKIRFIKDREDHDGYGSNVNVKEGLEILKSLSRIQPDSEPVGLGLYELIDIMLSPPGYTIVKNDGADTGVAMDVVKFATTLNAGLIFFETAEKKISDTYFGLFLAADFVDLRVRNFESWSNALTQINEIVEPAKPINDELRDYESNYRLLSDAYIHLYRKDSELSEQDLNTWENFYDSLNVDTPWLPSHRTILQEAKCSRNKVNTIIRYDKFSDQFNISLGRRSEANNQLNTLIFELSNFCNISCISIAGEDSLFLYDVQRWLRDSFDSEEIIIVSTKKKVSGSKLDVRVISNDSLMCK